jgi:beta-glucosidase/6-phospho-beta-glucosidase/beta-galactosidase
MLRLFILKNNILDCIKLNFYQEDVRTDIMRFIRDATIDQTDLHIIVEYLRSKDAHIYWSITPENLDTTFYGQSLSQSLAIKNIIKLAVNGDNLLIGTIEDFIAEHLEDLLEAFKGIRFNEIKIGIELADEDLRVIRDATRATIYYKEKGVMKLFEPEN